MRKADTVTVATGPAHLPVLTGRQGEPYFTIIPPDFFICKYASYDFISILQSISYKLFSFKNIRKIFRSLARPAALPHFIIVYTAYTLLLDTTLLTIFRYTYGIFKAALPAFPQTGSVHIHFSRIAVLWVNF